MNKILLAVLVTLLFVSAAFSASLINRYKTEHGFTIDLPFRWEQIPDRIMNSLENYTCGFQENPGEFWFRTYPYVLVQVDNTQRIKEGEFKDTDRVQIEFEREVERAIYEKNIPVLDHAIEDVFYDSESKTLYSTLVMIKRDSSTNRVLSAMRLTETGCINFLYYMGDSDNVEHHTGLFDEIINHVKVDESLVFTPRFSDHFMFLTEWKKRFFNSPKNGLIVLIICLGIWWSRNKIFGIK